MEIDSRPINVCITTNQQDTETLNLILTIGLTITLLLNSI